MKPETPTPRTTTIGGAFINTANLQPIDLLQLVNKDPEEIQELLCAARSPGLFSILNSAMMTYRVSIPSFPSFYYGRCKNDLRCSLEGS